MYYERTIKAAVQNVSETFPVLLVTGPRQVGESTLLESIIEPERKKVSLDNPTIRAFEMDIQELMGRMERMRSMTVSEIFERIYRWLHASSLRSGERQFGYLFRVVS